MNKLLSWSRSHAGSHIHPDLQVVYDDSQGYHGRARKKLATPTVITCPLKLTLSWLNLDHGQTAVVRHIQSPLQAVLNRVPNEVLSILVLVEQASLGENSFWHPYIDCLPPSEALTTPLYYTEEDLRWLEGTNVANATRERRQAWQEEWEAACSVLKDAGVDDSIYTW